MMKIGKMEKLGPVMKKNVNRQVRVRDKNRVNGEIRVQDGNKANRILRENT